MIAVQRRPSRRLLALVGALCAVSLAGELWGLIGSGSGAREIELLRQGWLAAALLLPGAALFDLLAIRRLRAPQVQRELPDNLALHDWAQVALVLRWETPLPGEVWIFDHHPESAETEGLPLRVPPGASGKTPSAARLEYRLRPMRRGDLRFGPVHLQASSPLGLWRFTSRCGEESWVRVYPNFAAVTRYGAMAMEQDTAQAGIRLRQRRGEGLEFHQLREYRAGDAMRQIDWKATSRKQQLVSREYQDERDQRVIFLLDCSRRMRTKDGDLSHFDHALNAMILLSHVALRAGDAVGLMSFGDETRWLPASKGVGSVNRILNTVYDLETTTLGSDFNGAAEELCARQPRRSLVVLLTNLREEDVEDLLPGVGLLKRRHMVLVANLREQKIDEVLAEEITDFKGALTNFGAWRHEQGRAKVQETLRHGGVLTLDSPPSALHAQLINSYYAIKRSGAL
jgi:uncharacterized protein (DUF58 family)